MRYVNKHNTESHWFGLVKIQDTRFPGTTLGLIKHKVPKYNRQKSNSKKKVQPSLIKQQENVHVLDAHEADQLIQLSSQA